MTNDEPLFSGNSGPTEQYRVLRRHGKRHLNDADELVSRARYLADEESSDEEHDPIAAAHLSTTAAALASVGSALMEAARHIKEGWE